MASPVPQGLEEMWQSLFPDDNRFAVILMVFLLQQIRDIYDNAEPDRRDVFNVTFTLCVRFSNSPFYEEVNARGAINSVCSFMQDLVPVYLQTLPHQ